MSYSPQSVGGRVMAIRQREEALRKYYLNPNICKYCKQPIPVEDNQKVREVIKKKFCNRSCAASYNNFGRKPSWAKPIGYCKECGAEFMFRKDKRGYYNKRRKYCHTCMVRAKARDYKAKPILDVTKGELFSKRKNWQSARSTITKNARNIFSSSGLKKECKVCGYNKHIQVSHIKDVSDFSDDIFISKINDITNLVALCPNHHWEFDNHLLSNEELIKIKY